MAQVYEEQVSSVAQRPQLDAMLAFIREGDVVVVTKLDRLARSMRDLLNIISTIESKGASLRILGMNLDTASATGMMITQVFSAVAEWERSAMLEQRESIAKAKAEGKYRGRVPTAQRKLVRYALLRIKARSRAPSRGI